MSESEYIKSSNNFIKNKTHIHIKSVYMSKLIYRDIKYET